MIFLHLLAWCLSRWFARDDLKRFPRWFWASCGETTVAFLSACLPLFTLSWLSLHRCVNDQIPFRDMHDLLASSCLAFESLICPWWFETLSPLILSILQWDNDSVPECMLDTIHLVLVEFAPVCKWSNPISRYAWSSCIFLHLLAWCLSRWFARDDLKRFPRWFWASCSETTVAFLSACLTIFTLSWLSLLQCVIKQITFRDMMRYAWSFCLSRWFARDDLKRFPRWFWASCSETTIAFLSACLTLFTLPCLGWVCTGV